MSLSKIPPHHLRNLPIVLAVALSALLHAALLLGTRVGQVERPGVVPHRLEVRLAQVEPARKPEKSAASDAGLPPQAAEPEPLPDPAPPPRSRSDPAQPAPDPGADMTPARPGMPQAAAGSTTIDLPLPPDPTYYPARQVDEHPVLLSDTKPVYPEEAARSNLPGEVIVLMLLNEHGRADEVSIIEAKPPGKGFEEAVIAWLRDARFKPAVRQGRAVKARVVYHVTFEP
ncbi:MAG: energy transducer TonB [Burkholderiales bacterium]